MLYTAASGGTSRFLVRSLAILAFAVNAFAGEYAVLSSGFKIHAQSHVSDGDTVRLKSEKGEIALPANQVKGFEIEEYTPPPPPPPAPPTPVAEAPKPSQPVDPKLLIALAGKEAGLPPALVQLV